MNAQRKYDAKVRSKQIKDAMENSLNGNKIMQLLDLPQLESYWTQIEPLVINLAYHVNS